MMKNIGIGVIGLERMGRVYGAVVAGQVAETRLVAVSDPRPEAMDEFTARASSLKAYSHYHDLLADREIDGVIVVTPTSTHREVVTAAAEAGKAIFCEKPTALTLADTDKMIEAIE